MKDRLTGKMPARVIRLAGFRVGLETADARVMDFVDRRYAAFCAAPQDGAEIRLRCEPHDGRNWAATGAQEGTAPRIAKQRDGRLHISRKDFRAALDLEAGAGHVDYHAPALVTALESALRICFSFLAIDKHGLVLHAAAVLRHGRAFLFPGPSGTGKSTLAALATREETVLSDELVVARRRGDGFELFGTPFFGSTASVHSNKSGLLGATLFPVKDNEARLTPLRGADALRKLLAASLVFGPAPAPAQTALQTACDLLDQAPFHNMHFPRDPSLWPLLNAFDDAAKGTVT